ncbi:Hypothetical predicted protein [Mytilus galloprovincialis]|uniref:Uncharacterized protein n=1 Tax=Mytilus galloprovincialis TaxID=29158 RepID=A0A8B6BHI0_MYTGA|nr:Hypothetical predicted protein [Mytilus galloprovincialis]
MTPKTTISGKHFFELCLFIKDKCNDIKSDNASIDDTLTDVDDRFVRDSEKLTESEKTVLNVMCMLIPMVDALISSKRYETLVLHETKINRLQAGMRNTEYPMDALAQYSRKENVRVSGIKEVNVKTDEMIIDSVFNIGAAMDVQMNPVTIGDDHRLKKNLRLKPDKLSLASRTVLQETGS